MAVRDERWVRRLGFAVLGLALVPIVVAVGRAVASGWAPTFDGGYFTVRSRDVLTSHHPWLGAWSSGSASVDATIYNLGPLQFDLLAPFTKVDPYWGTAVGVGVVAIASVVAVWWAADRVLGSIGAVAAMLATLALEATIGTQAFIDPRQQIYLLMPYWALLWLTWATATGRGAAIPPLVFAASLITQTHFTYLLQTAVLVLVGLGLYIAVTLRGLRLRTPSTTGSPALEPTPGNSGAVARQRWRAAGATRWLLIGLAVAVVCWAQPLWDQVAGDRNLGAVLTNRGAGEGVGWNEGAQFIASTVLTPPNFWRPGTMGQLHLLGGVSQPAAWGVIVLWFGAARRLCRRRVDPRPTATGDDPGRRDGRVGRRGRGGSGDPVDGLRSRAAELLLDVADRRLPHGGGALGRGVRSAGASPRCCLGARSSPLLSSPASWSRSLLCAQSIGSPSYRVLARQGNGSPVLLSTHWPTR